MKNSWSKTATVLGLAVALAAGLTACTNSDNKDGAVSTPSGTLVSAGATQAVETVTVAKDGINEAPALSDQASVLADFQQSKCEAGPGKATAAGTVVNRSDKARDIVATASWKKPDATKPVAQAAAVMKQVPAGESRAFEITSNVPGGKDDVYLCGLRVDAGTLK